ncbi:MAG: four-carbon acid sugar kinase family protein [Pedosphaera sp.]|nr:four-carbon acid sugar kinase family protein [Pedosphaera sp.]
MTQVYLLADDLSGALEAGAAFSAVGWKVVLPLGATPPAAGEAGSLEVFSTETRSMGAAEAAVSLRRILAEREATGAQLLFKKIDSTLRGPLGAEVGALITELAPPLVVICPANPAVGRTVRDGILYVNGVRLEKTDFRHDPAWPAKTGDVRARFAEQGVMMTGHIPLAVLAAGEAAVRAHISARRGTGQGTSVLVSDAESSADIRTLVLAVRQADPETVFVGSGALGSVLAGLCPPPQKRNVTAMQVVGSMAVLCGSRHPASHRQLNQFVRECHAAVLHIKPGAPLAGLVDAAVVNLDARRHLVVKCDIGAVAQTPTSVSDCLAEFAFELAEIRLPGVFYLTGGETAYAVCRRLGGKSLEIIRELEAGIILSLLRRFNHPDVAVITKPGGYGREDIMVKHFHEITKK